MRWLRILCADCEFYALVANFMCELRILLVGCEFYVRVANFMRGVHILCMHFPREAAATKRFYALEKSLALLDGGEHLPWGGAAGHVARAHAGFKGDGFVYIA